MNGDGSGSEMSQARRIELILEHVDELPTLSPVAVRLLDLTADERAESGEVIDLISSDPSLAGKVLKLCQCDLRGRGSQVTTVERAVLQLGFDAVRSAVLSVQVFELFDRVETPGGETPPESPLFERDAFWHHSLAVAVLAQAIAVESGLQGRLDPDEAFLAGLLHDLGVLALHVLLPQSFDRVCQYAETNGVSLDQACHRILGLDTHTAGKRLAEHWRMPRPFLDTIWLHGQPRTSLPDLPHRDLIGLVTLADAVARRCYITPMGHGPRGAGFEVLCQQYQIDPASIKNLARQLHQEVEARATSLGLHGAQSAELLLSAVSRANESLGRINEQMRRRSVMADRQAAMLEAIRRFHDPSAAMGSFVGVLGQVVQSAASVLGGSYFAVLHQSQPRDAWQVVEFAADGRSLRTQVVQPGPDAPAVSELAGQLGQGEDLPTLPGWLRSCLAGASQSQRIRALDLRCSGGVTGILLHNAPAIASEQLEQIEPLRQTWSAAVGAAAEHEATRRLSEQLAGANRILSETQEELARRESLVAVGEMAAGAAHEMNNPLTVISGRSQLMANRLLFGVLRGMAEQIVEQSHCLSDMITALRLFAHPQESQPRPTDIRELLQRTIDEMSIDCPGKTEVKLVIEQELPKASLDREQIGGAVAELIRNAMESEGSTQIEVQVQIDPLDDRLRIQVTDNGPGLSDEALAHAFEPFFSHKPAGRQPGLGLAQARRLIEAHGGQIRVENRPGGGARATILLKDWRVRADAGSRVA